MNCNFGKMFETKSCHCWYMYSGSTASSAIIDVRPIQTLAIAFAKLKDHMKCNFGKMFETKSCHC